MNTILNKTIEQSENLNKSKNLQQYSQSLNSSIVNKSINNHYEFSNGRKTPQIKKGPPKKALYVF